MYIGNIITSDIDNAIPDYVNVVNNKDDIINNLPTLSVGWFKTKEMFGLPNLDVQNKIIDKNIYWTFSKYEKKDIYTEDLNKFYKEIINQLKIKVNYNFISLVNCKYKNIKKLIKYIDNNEDKIIYVYNYRMVYIYNKNNVYGISLDEVEFIGLNKEKILKRLYKNVNHNFRCTDSEIMIMNNDLINDLKENIMLIPYIYCVGA